MKKILRDGKTEYGTVGEESPFKDDKGATLFVGDVVEKFKNGKSGGKSFVVKTEGYGCFIMGIQCCCKSSTGKIEGWTIEFVRGYNLLNVGDKYDSITVFEVEEEIKTSKKIEKVLCIKDGKMCGVGEQFCTVGKHYEVTRENNDSFNIIDDAGDDHNFTKENNVWFELIFQEDNELKVGDIVTAAGDQWLEGAYAKIVKIENQCATIEVIDKGNKSSCCERVGFMDDGWKLEWLVKVTDFKPSEQLKDNIKEDDVVKIKVGDKVKVVNKSKILNVVGEVDLGDTAIIENIEKTNSYKIRMDKDNNYWYAKAEELELFKEPNPKFEIITSGTTTTVKFEDGREGVAKLYYKDTYNKGFGIVAALAKAMDIDLIGEVQKVVGSYEIRGTKPKLTIVDEVVFAHTFKVGDIIRGTETGNKRYGITNKRVLEAEVTNVRSDGSKIDILIKKYEGGRNYDSPNFSNLESEFFELVEAPSVKLEVGCKVKIPTTKQGKSDRHSAAINTAKRRGQDYLFLIKIRTDNISGKDIYVLNEDNGGYGDYFHLEDLELYEETPSLKKPILKEEVKAEPVVFKVGDSVKVREDLVPGTEYFKGVWFHPTMAQYKGKIFKVTAANLHYYSLDNISWNWTYDMLEKVEEKAEDEVTVTAVEPEFKVGDYVYYETSSGEFNICKIERINDNELWGYWTSNYIKELPKTIKKFESLKVNSWKTYVNTGRGNSYKKLVLIDDSEPEIKVGDMVTKEQAIKVIKNGGEIKAYGFIYFEECGILKFKNGERIAENSSGYDINLGGKLEVVSLLKNIDKFQAETMIKEGKEIIVNNIFKYFLEDGVLMFRSNKTGRLHESLGFKEAFKEEYIYSIA